ncbi:MAG: hypothetical protein P9M03_04940 [Candidatus Theseobacter exili]|nr:hypothetical protein [Candidatus Theseobacter exili]
MAEINNDDRKLGDEWSDWDGDVSDQQIITSRKPFLLISLLSAIILVLVLFVFWYLIHPRIISFGKSFAWIAGIIITASSIFFLTIVLYIIVLATSKRRGCPYSSTVISGWLLCFIMLVQYWERDLA